MKKLYPFIVCALLLGGCTKQKEKTSVTGVLTNALTNQPMAGENIYIVKGTPYIFAPGFTDIDSTTTDAGGRYYLEFRAKKKDRHLYYAVFRGAETYSRKNTVWYEFLTENGKVHSDPYLTKKESQVADITVYPLAKLEIKEVDVGAYSGSGTVISISGRCCGISIGDECSDNDTMVVKSPSETYPSIVTVPSGVPLTITWDKDSNNTTATITLAHREESVFTVEY